MAAAKGGVFRYSMHEFMHKVVPKYSKGTNEYIGRSSCEEWDLDVNRSTAIARSMNGDTSYVGLASANYDLMTSKVALGSERRLSNEFVGSSVSVPAFLSGAPKAMRRRLDVAGYPRSVRIYSLQSCVSYTRASKMQDRGIALLSLLQMLQACRIAVELWLVVENAVTWDRSTPPPPGEPCDQSKCCTLLVQVEADPLCISQSGFAVCHPAFTRNIMYGFKIDRGCEPCGLPTKDMEAGGYWSGADYAKAFKKRLALEPTDIVIPGADNDEDCGEAFIRKHLQTAGVLAT